ncbi:kinase-like domain-containing protein [Tanacetum coccineum]
MKEVLDIKYKELEESKPILEVLENYVMYKKKLDEILIGKERLNKQKFSEEEKVGIIEHGLPKKMCDPRNYVLPVKINGVVEMVALVDTRASVSVLPYSLYKDLGLGDLRPCQTNLTMVDNTQAKAMGEVKNVRIQIGYQAYVVYLLIFDISVDPELPLLLGRPFLRTCGAIIDMGRGSFEVGRDEDGNVKYGPITPSFIDIEDDMERTLAMEAYFNPFKNVIVTYKKVDGDGDWHARFKIVTPSGRKFNQAFKTKTTTRKLSGKFKAEDVLSFEDTLREMMILEYIYEGDGDMFVDYSWERALLIDNEIYLEWVLEFFSTLYFDKNVDRNNLMKEKCIWFRLCGHEHILTLPEFAILLGLFTEDEVKHRLFKVYFGKLEVDYKQFDHKDYWTRVGKPTLTNHMEVLVKEPLMRIVNKVIMGSLVHRVASRDRCQKRGLWMMSALEESRGVNLAWIITNHLYKHAPRTKENSISKMLADELDVENTCLTKETEMPTQAEEGSSEPRQEHRGLNSSWRDWNTSLSKIERGNVWRDSMLFGNIIVPNIPCPLAPSLADQGNLHTKLMSQPNIFHLYRRILISIPDPYTHYLNLGNQSNQGGSYGLGGDDYFTRAMPDFGGSSSRYAVRGLSRGVGFNDDDMDE